LIEDNIVAVSRQMIDKEASVAKKAAETNGHHDVDGVSMFDGLEPNPDARTRK
jgi:hypothetical protein